MPRSILESAWNIVRTHEMLKPGMAVLVGVSGGPDSVALLDILLEFSASLELRLGVAHLNHGLRGTEADLDANFVQSLAKDRGLPYLGQLKNIRDEQKRTGRSLEEAARDARLKFLHEEAKRHGYEKIALGHHRDDHAEQVLINLLRGSGPDGLCGIPPIRGRIIRPLIRSTRAEILEYLSSRHLSFRIDRSNEDLCFLRNRIRLHLLPELQNKYNPGIADGLSRLGEILQAEKEWISGLVDPIFDSIVCLQEARRIEIRISAMLPCHPALQRRLVRKAIKRVKGDLRRITLSHVESVTDLIKPDRDGSRIDLPDRIRASRSPHRLVITRENMPLRSIPKEEAPGAEAYAYIVSKDRILTKQPICVPEAGVFLTFEKISASGSAIMADLRNIKKEEAFLDLAKLTFPLTIRNCRPGDRFVPLGMHGSQKLKKFWIDHKVESKRRNILPLLVSGNDIVWAAGFRIAESVKITPSTRMVLRVALSIK